MGAEAILLRALGSTPGTYRSVPFVKSVHHPPKAGLSHSFSPADLGQYNVRFLRASSPKSLSFNPVTAVTPSES